MPLSPLPGRNGELLSRKEAAAYLGTSEHTLAVWASTKRYALRYIKIGRLVRYRKADLDAFIARNVVDSEPRGRLSSRSEQR